MRQTRHVISVSAGKDSTALLLLAIQRCPASQIEAIFCDTGNEHRLVYEYLDYLESALNIRITRLRADFTDEIAHKRMFIARDRRGCMPCINAGKDEIREIAVRFPEYMTQKADWEMRVSQVSKQGYSTFFNKGLHQGMGELSDRRIMDANNIDNVIRWSKTSRGGRQTNMFDQFIDPQVCASAYGLCG